MGMACCNTFASRLGAALTIACIAASCSSGDTIDERFDTRVARPAYQHDGPVVLFDEAHHNVHRARASYRPFTELMESDGYRVIRGKQPITRDALARASVLVVSNALGTNERNDDLALTDAECDAIRDWVSAGGAFLFVVDHYPTGHAVANLADRFGIELSKGVVEDSVQHDTSFDPTHIVYSRDNGGLPSHPIVDGRDPTERVNRVLTFTGEAIHAAPPAATFLALSRTAVARPARPRVERRNGDVIVHVEYGDPESVPGWSQGLTLEFGKGRVVVLGEAAMLTARLSRFDGSPIGMNTAGYDNRQLALNAMHWLTRLL